MSIFLTPKSQGVVWINEITGKVLPSRRLNAWDEVTTVVHPNKERRVFCNRRRMAGEEGQWSLGHRGTRKNTLHPSFICSIIHSRYLLTAYYVPVKKEQNLKHCILGTSNSLVGRLKEIRKECVWKASASCPSL